MKYEAILTLNEFFNQETQDDVVPKVKFAAT